MALWTSTMRRSLDSRTSLWVCSLALLAIAEPAMGGAGDLFDGVYTGKRVLTKGPAGSCQAEESVSVTIHDGVLTFTNGAFAKLRHWLRPPSGRDIHRDTRGYRG